MYYLKMSHREILTMDLAELRWHQNRLQQVQKSEMDLEKLKLDVLLHAVTGTALKGSNAQYEDVGVTRDT